MLTVLEALTKSAEFLGNKGIDSARINAELLLANILDCKRLELYLMYDRPLREDELDAYREYLKRRSTFEPLQYIIGKVEFYGLELKISSDVLIPRPETELLVETIINSVSKDEKLNILDIGSGSGNISIALAVHLAHAFITSIDICEKAIKVANENAHIFELNERVKFFKSDVLNVSEKEFNGVDIIVSNPPYVSQTDYLTLQNEIKDFEPDFAITDFSDGYKFYKHIVKLSRKILKPGGKLFFEIAQGQSEKVKKFLLQSNFNEVSIIKDYQRIDRVISGVLS